MIESRWENAGNILMKNGKVARQNVFSETLAFMKVTYPKTVQGDSLLHKISRPAVLSTRILERKCNQVCSQQPLVCHHCSSSC